MKTRETVIPLKGNRHYVQGPDIFNALANAFDNAAPGRPWTNLRFSIHNELNQGNVRITISPDKTHLPKVTECAGWMVWECGDEQIFGALTAVSDSSVVERVEYDESQITDNCEIEDQRIMLRKTSPHSFAETIVSMHKLLLQTQFPSAPGRWAFTKLELNEISPHTEGLTLELTHKFGYRLVKSRIVSGACVIGNI